MLVIRLSRVGKKKAPIYRIVVMPKTRDPWAKNLEILGHYNPLVTPKELVIKQDRLNEWLKNGAQPSDTVWNLLITHKLIEGEKRNVTHISGKRTKDMEKAVADKKAKEDAAKAKADAAKAAEDAAKEAAKEAAKAEAEAAKEAAKAAAEAPAVVAEEAVPVVEEAPAEVAAE